MGSLTEDLLEIILARLPLKSITASKLVCKQWKTIVESPFFRELFLSHHQNSHSSWSLFLKGSQREVVAHYGCKTWGLTRSLGSYVSSFLADKFKTHKEKVIVLAYTDVGLILFTLRSKSKNPPYFVANPISRQCVEIPPRPLGPRRIREGFLDRRPGLATRVENDLLLGYKVVLVDISETDVLSLHVYSSETGLWSYNTLQSHPELHNVTSCTGPITLNGNLYCFGYNIIASHDLYAESDRWRVILYPDEGQDPIFIMRSCTISQGFLMYTNFFSVGQGYKLRAWRLKSWEWQLVSEISTVTTLDYFPFAINPFDGNTMYMWSKMHRQYRLRDGGTLSFAGKRELKEEKNLISTPFVLPRWLHRIPS